MENCPRLALEFGLRIGLELGFGAWGGNFPRGQLSYSQPLVGFRKISPEKNWSTVRVRVWVRDRVRVNVGGGQFSSGAIVLEPFW